MVKFVREKQEELAAKQFEVRDDIVALHDVLAQVKDDPSVDQEALAAAQEVYSIACWRFLYETGYDTSRLTEEHAGKMASHDFEGSMDLLEGTQKIVRDAAASLQ